MQQIGASLGSAAPLLLLPLAIKRERIKYDVPPNKIFACSIRPDVVEGNKVGLHAVFAAAFGRPEGRWEGRWEG
jgi:hypothetical protein